MGPMGKPFRHPRTDMSEASVGVAKTGLRPYATCDRLIGIYWRARALALGRHGLLFAFGVTGLMLRGQPLLPPKVNCLEPQNPQTIVLHLKAVMTPPSPGLHWVVDPLPTGDDLMVSDPALKAAIEAWVSEQTTLDP